MSNGDERQIDRSEDNLSLYEGSDNKDPTIVALLQSKERDNKILSGTIVPENPQFSNLATIDPPDSIYRRSLIIPDLNIRGLHSDSPSAIAPQSSSNLDDPTLCNTLSAFDHSTFLPIRDAIKNDDASIHKQHLLPERLQNENSILIGPSIQCDGIDAHTEVYPEEDMLKEGRVTTVSPNGDDTPPCGISVRERLPDEDSTAPAHAGPGLTDNAHSPGPTDTNASSGLEKPSTSSSTSLEDAKPGIRFTSSDRVELLELTDRIKQSLENMCGQTIWWPLKPRRQICPRRFTRISWKCVRKTALSNLYIIF